MCTAALPRFTQVPAQEAVPEHRKPATLPSHIVPGPCIPALFSFMACITASCSIYIALTFYFVMTADSYTFVRNRLKRSCISFLQAPPAATSCIVTTVSQPGS